MNRSFLAIDLGAESGRGVIGDFDGNRVALREIGRFETGRGSADMCSDGVLRWDLPRFEREIFSLLERAQAATNGKLAGVGVDGWAVDFGLLDENHKLLAAPVCYRDQSHAVARERTFKRLPEEQIWEATGIQGLPFNTLYQIAALQDRDPRLLDQARSLLLIPDLVHNLLTDGSYRSSEVTNASTTQMMHPGGAGWNFDLLNALELPSHFLSPVIEAGSHIGATSRGIPVFAPATHDTASAVVAVPAETSDRDWAFLSSGTWSLLGAEVEQPVMDHAIMRARFSNERAAGGKTRLLKNIMGLWLVQQVRRQLNADRSQRWSYAELSDLATLSPPGALIDAVDERLLNPPDMIAEIQAMCRESGQPIPTSPGQIVRCCLESLALAYRRSLRELSSLLDRRFSTLHIIGGGSENILLNQWTANASGIRVLAGASEATALGNILGQLLGAGLIASWDEPREISRQTFTPREFLPDQMEQDRWLEREGLLS